MMRHVNDFVNNLGDEDPVRLIPQENEDMWHANNLIAVGDILSAHAVRKVSLESTTGSSHTERVHTELTIQVTSTFFDPTNSSLHVSGRVQGGNEFVSSGKYHTLHLEPDQPFTLWKKYGWDSVAIQTLKDALDKDRDGAIAAVVMDEGQANICLISNFQTLLKQRVTPSKSRGSKGGGRAGSTEDKASRSFFQKTLATLLRTLDFSQPRPLLLASPGFVAANFRLYMIEEGTHTGDKSLISLGKNSTVTHSSSAAVHALNEVLKNPEVLALMKEKKSSADTKCLESLQERLRKGDARAWYGVRPVEKAVAEGAVGPGGGVLLINNDLFRSQDMAIRMKYVALVDKVKGDGGEVRVLSSDHQSGSALQGLGGIAAMLTYPIFDLDEDYDDEDRELDPEEPTII